MNAAVASRTVAAGRRQIADNRTRALIEAKLRVLWVLVVFGLVALGAIVRIGQLGMGELTLLRSGSMHEALLPKRGDIVDRNGVPLARAFTAYALWYDPDALGEGTPLVKSPGEVAAALVRIFPDMDQTVLKARLASGKHGYLRRRILPDQANRVHALGEPALQFPREYERFYPQGSMAAHVLGFVDADGKGRVGMEEVFDERLRDPSSRGTPSALSIDTRVQGALEDELLRGIRDTQAKGAAGVILDVDSGEILALASLPSFNPNLIDSAGTPNIFNRVTNQVYELGSTFKPISVAAALDAGSVTDLSRRYSAVPFKMGNYTIRDSHASSGSLNVAETLIHSSNIVTAQIADELGGAKLKATLSSLGFDERPYVELPAKGFPLWRSGEWPRITTMTVAYGHGIAVTPLHLASAYSAMVNGGIWRPSTLQKLAPGNAPKGRRVFKASTSARMRQLLRMIVVYGTGKRADAAGFRIGGKTGSAEKPGQGGYRKSSLVSTFAAAFPMDRPRYVIIVMLDEPQGTAASSGQRTAGFTSAPIVGRVVPRIGPLLGVMPDETRDIDITDLRQLLPGEAKE